MNAMTDDGARPEKPGARVDVDVASRLGKQCGDARDLGLVFVGVDLDVAIRKFARKGARRLKLRLS
jgi:hypothetical protein